MNRISLIITGDELATAFEKHLEKHKIKCLKFSKCRGYSNKFNFMEFVGMADTKKTLLAFQSGKLKAEAISKFIIKYYNYKNNGIMFALQNEGDEMSENVLFVAIVNMGKSEKVIEVIRKTAMAGATVLDARGNGFETEEFFGVEIGTGKEVVLSALAKAHLPALKKAIMQEFDQENTDVVQFALPITNFSKLHQDK